LQAGAYYRSVRGGVTLPIGRKIKRGMLRGEVSEGGCWASRTSWSWDGHDGLLTMAGVPATGTPLTEGSGGGERVRDRRRGGRGGGVEALRTGKRPRGASSAKSRAENRSDDAQPTG
jgi:hypothetical protein